MRRSTSAPYPEARRYGRTADRFLQGAASIGYNRRVIRRLNVASKVVLLALIAVSLVFGQAERFRDKAMGARAVAYPLLCAIPAVLFLSLRAARRPIPYPHAGDALLTTPFVLDLAGNALDLFDTISWWDDLLHFANWLLLGLALAQVLPRVLPAWVRGWMIAGFGAFAAVVWELAEYSTFVLSLGSGGALLAGLLVAVTSRRRTATRAPAQR
jgi:hypothetical protein